MKFATLERVFRALDARAVRYIVAGGVAVNAHGYRRVTDDLDLALAMEKENVLAAIEALAELGYRPVLPVPASGFADAAIRGAWIKERNLRVFSLASGLYRDLTIDLFATPPFDFAEEFDAAQPIGIAPGLAVRFLTLPTLIRIKEEAARPRDLDDAAHLKEIARRGSSR